MCLWCQLPCPWWRFIYQNKLVLVLSKITKIKHRKGKAAPSFKPCTSMIKTFVAQNPLINPVALNVYCTWSANDPHSNYMQTNGKWTQKIFFNLFFAYFIELQCAGTVLTCFSIHQNTWCCLCLTTCKTTRRYYLSNRVFCVHFYLPVLE